MEICCWAQASFESLDALQRVSWGSKVYLRRVDLMEIGGKVAAIEVFMIDPPWPKKKGGKRSVRPKQGKNLNYKTMSVDDIFGLLDSEILVRAASTHVVFLWTIDSFLRTAEEEMHNRGYRQHARIIWDKENGIAPAFTIRYQHEYLLWYYKPSLLPICVEMRGKLGSVIRAKSRQHSRKPDEAYNYVDALYPNAIKIDVFSRETRNGWLQYGDQCNLFDRETNVTE